MEWMVGSESKDGRQLKARGKGAVTASRLIEVKLCCPSTHAVGCELQARRRAFEAGACLCEFIF